MATQSPQWCTCRGPDAAERLLDALQEYKAKIKAILANPRSMRMTTITVMRVRSPWKETHPGLWERVFGVENGRAVEADDADHVLSECLTAQSSTYDEQQFTTALEHEGVQPKEVVDAVPATCLGSEVQKVGVFVAEAAVSLVPGQGGTNEQYDVEVAEERAWDR
ncbi:hypothetical protein OS493_002211 [Desmophyllum pertusum]|uniref:Uncharacterized protein n=1 Tax=Desmophyllum pertusum TaxID=174260 RepID=A0A9W9Z5K8_9CNID|nr:hypothetical protein OS493_002211 [Desmophyllum pertusum]